ncbi:MAG: DUF1573 domain-containing protein [Planctomycetota bacterium]
MHPNNRIPRLAAAIGLLAALAGPSLAAEPKAPRMVISPTHWDFGTLKQGQTASRTLQVRNKGDAPLIIKYVRSTCAACLGRMAGETKIPPGGRTELKLTFYSKRARGRQRKVVYVHTNEPDRPYTAVQIRGRVVRVPGPELAVEPEELDFGLVTGGRPRRLALTLRNNGETPLTIRGVRDTPACSVEGEEKATLKPGEALEWHAVLDPARTKGMLRESLTVLTNDPLTPARTVLVSGYVARAEKRPGPDESVLIRPSGKPVAVPGQEDVFFRTYQVTNRLLAPVRVELKSETPKTVTLKPGERREISVDPGADRTTFTVSIPSTLPTDAEE